MNIILISTYLCTLYMIFFSTIINVQYNSFHGYTFAALFVDKFTYFAGFFYAELESDEVFLYFAGG